MWVIDVPEIEDAVEAAKVAKAMVNKGEVTPEPEPDTVLLFAALDEGAQKASSDTAQLVRHMLALDAGDRNVIAQRLNLQLTIDPEETGDYITQMLQQAKERELLPELVEEMRKRHRYRDRATNQSDLLQKIRVASELTPVADLLQISQFMGLHTDEQLKALVAEFDSVEGDDPTAVTEAVKPIKHRAVQTMLGRACEHQEEVLPRLLELMVNGLAQRKEEAENADTASPEPRLKQQNEDPESPVPPDSQREN